MEIPMDISTWDDKCMQAFIRENASMFRVFAFRYLQDEEAVDDVLQESYMKLWINRFCEIASQLFLFYYKKYDCG